MHRLHQPSTAVGTTRTKVRTGHELARLGCVVTMPVHSVSDFSLVDGVEQREAHRLAHEALGEDSLASPGSGGHSILSITFDLRRNGCIVAHSSRSRLQMWRLIP